jgi:uncharacterized protein YjbI with pentapeptide repeats
VKFNVLWLLASGVVIYCFWSPHSREAMSICNHSYVARYHNRPASLGQECPYAQFYDRVRPTGAPPSEAGGASFLPFDSSGACIFHSQERAWKRQNDFTGEFLQLVRMLDEHDAERYYDFAEFVFPGNDLITKRGVEEYSLRITDTIFRKEAYFTGASFPDLMEFERVDFQQGASFDQAQFHRDLKFEKARIRGLDFTEAKFTDGVSFKGVEFLSYTLFSSATFAATTNSPLVLFKDSRFEGIADFSAADFTLGNQSAVSFSNVEFQDFADFRNTHFNCQVQFSDVCFADTTDFIDTSFDMVRSTARYRGTAVEFNQIQVPTDAVLSFVSTDANNKMFNHDVQMSFKEDPSGTVRFENVNFNLLTASSKERLIQLAKSGRVEIGSGCIKYRFQTEVQTIFVSKGNAALILELCQTFTNYFTASNGVNLGFEIVERNPTKVSFFYFTDEDVSEDTFRERLARTKHSLWDLLSVGSEEQLLTLQGPTGIALSTEKESGLINAVDAISALLGTFFRIGARIALGRWTEADTAALLNAIPLNQEVARRRAPGLHQLLVDRYTRGTLLGLSGRLNERLFSEGAALGVEQALRVLQIRESNMQKKIKILFLAANPTDTSALRLGEEVRQIEEKITFGSHREAFELIQQHAVRVSDLQRILLKHQPHIVHFSGHGSKISEIVLEDGLGKSKPVSKEAISALFRILKDNVRVVVLNACFSKPQAEALDEIIDYVIGMNKQVGDKMAISFAGAFYQALAFGRTVTEAFDLAKVELDLVRLPGSDTPELLVRAGANVKSPLITPQNKRAG